MKKNLWIWAIAALSMAACTSEDVPTTEQIVTENDWISPDGRVVVQLGAESTPAAVISRAPIINDDPEDITVLQDLGIFAINRNEAITTEEFGDWPNTIDNVLLKNVKALGTANDPLDETVNPGKRLSLYNKEASSAGAVYYYPIQGDQNFNFYGYQPRTNAAVALNSGKPQVTITLDGDVDLITGEAPAADPVNETDLYVTEATAEATATKGTGGELNGYNAKYVRKVKFHNWIIDESQDKGTNAIATSEKKPFIPNISFGHRLTKLNFQIITAKEQTGGGNQNESTETGGDRTEATTLRVNTIKLTNVYKTAALSIEPTMPITYSNRDALAMIENGEATTIWEGEDIKPQAYQDVETPTYTSAGYLMVPATTDIADYTTNPYSITLNVKSTDSTGVPQIQAITLSLKDQTFEAGKSYNIRIALYALQKVYVSAELTPWDTDTDDVYIPVE